MQCSNEIRSCFISFKIFSYVDVICISFIRFISSGLTTTSCGCHSSNVLQPQYTNDVVVHWLLQRCVLYLC